MKNKEKRVKNKKMKNEPFILHFLFRTHFFLSEGIPFFQ